jgi:hypothetical protein
MSRNPHEDFSEDEVDSRYPNIPQDSQGLQEDGGAGRSSMVSTNPKTRRNRSLTTGRHTVGGAPPPEAISAQAHDDSEEYFRLRTNIALLVRKHRELSLQI